MSQLTHTPGTRHVIPASSGACGDGGHGYLVQAHSDADPDGVIVAECDQAGDAALDAAGPALLTAAEGILDRLARSDPDDLDFGRGFVEWKELAALRAAVAKAKTI